MKISYRNFTAFWLYLMVCCTGLLPCQDYHLVLTGSVITDAGMPPPGEVAIQLLCLGTIEQEVRTDQTGRFQMQPSLATGRGRGQSAPWTMDSSWSTSREFRGSIQMCELRISVPGFHPAVLSLSGVDKPGLVRLAPIVISRSGRESQRTVGLSSLQVPRQARKVWEKGHRALAAGRMNEAQNALETAVQIHPRYAAAWTDLGRTHLQRSHYPQARAAFEKAIQSDESFLASYAGLAVLAAQQQDWAETAEWTGRALRLQPRGWLELHYLHALANFRLGVTDVAESSAQQAQELDLRRTVPAIDHLLAEIQMRKQNYASAAAYLRRYLERALKSIAVDIAKQQLAEMEALANTR